MRYRAFRRKKDNLFYFQFLNEDGGVLLNSQAYQDKDACFNGIRSVLANAGDSERYEKSIDGDGNHFFILKAGNNQEIGRSTKYDNEAAVDGAISNFISDGPDATSKAAQEESDSDSSKAADASQPYEANTSGTDDYRPLAFYESRISGAETGIDSFDADDGEFYFTYNLASKVILISEGYKADKSRDNGANSVLKNLPIPERYQREVHPNGKHYFNLRAGNNQEIATSRWFDSADAMESAIGILQGGGAGSKDALVAAGLLAASANDKIYKDYKPLGFYQEHIAGTEFGYDDFAQEDAYYFTVNYEGSPVLISEDYTSESGRDNGISSVKKNVKKEERYERMVHPNGKHYFNLLAGNKQEIATSRWFDSKKDMEKAIRWLTSTGGTRRRKKAVREKKANERRYIKQNQNYLCNNITYDTFQSGGNEKFYFVFKDKDGKAVLINGDVRGFKTEEDLNNGIKSVLEHGPKSAKYDIRSTKNGKVYFYIQNEEGKNIARSSLFYDTEEDMKAAMALIQCVGATMVGASAAPEAKSERVVDDYLPCVRYKADGPGFHKFQDEDSKEYYFSYNDNEGDVLLRSEGYTTEAARDNGIASVEKNAPLEERWTKGTVLDGKYHYYALKAGNHQEIARSCYHDDEAGMLAAFATTGQMFAPEPEPVAAAPLTSEAVVDDYLPCASYAGETGFHTFTHDDNGEHYFSYNRSDGKTLLRSEGYTQAAARDNGIQSVIKNSPIDERWGTGKALNDKYHYYFLKAGNHQEIARSCYYEDEAAMLADLAWIKGEDSPIGLGSSLVGGTLMSAGMLRLRAEEEEAAAKAKAEEEARLAAAAAAKAKAEEEARLAAEAAAKAKAEEEARLAAAAKAKEEKAAAAALAAAAAAEAARRKKEEEAAALALAAKEREEKAAAAAAMAAKKAEEEKAATAAAAYASTGGGSDNGGCMKWLPWLLGLLLLAGLLWWLLGRDACKKADPTPPPVEVPVDTTPVEPEPEPEPFGKNGDEMGYDAGSLEYLMANHLSGAGSTFPSGRLDADGVTFARNSARLNSAARKQLDNVIALLKEYPDARIDIYGYITDNESGTGNKEVSLDDDRARAIYNYLKRGGIDEARMNFQGDGLGDRRGADIRILSR